LIGAGMPAASSCCVVSALFALIYIPIGDVFEFMELL